MEMIDWDNFYHNLVFFPFITLFALAVKLAVEKWKNFGLDDVSASIINIAICGFSLLLASFMVLGFTSPSTQTMPAKVHLAQPNQEILFAIFENKTYISDSKELIDVYKTHPHHVQLQANLDWSRAFGQRTEFKIGYKKRAEMVEVCE